MIVALFFTHVSPSLGRSYFQTSVASRLASLSSSWGLNNIKFLTKIQNTINMRYKKTNKLKNYNKLQETRYKTYDNSKVLNNIEDTDGRTLSSKFVSSVRVHELLLKFLSGAILNFYPDPQCHNSRSKRLQHHQCNSRNIQNSRNKETNTTNKRCAWSRLRHSAPTSLHMLTLFVNYASNLSANWQAFASRPSSDEYQCSPCWWSLSRASDSLLSLV